MTEESSTNTMPSNAESFAFQAEIHQLMSLIIHSFYSNKDIFLRELVANASDAMDKYRYVCLNEKGSVQDAQDLKIQITGDKEQKKLIIEDNGIGMSKKDMIENLGTIAKSGTKQFVQMMTEKKDLSMIGQFGVGFYSAYLVAEKVTVISRGYMDEETYVWESDAGGSFTIRPAPEEWKMERGTRILLDLKEDQLEYAEEEKIRSVIQKHSGFINYPMELFVHRTREIDVEEKSEETTEETQTEEGVVEEEEPKVEEKKVITEEYTEWEVLNKQKPIWMRKPEEVTQEEYNSFYKSVCSDWEDPLAVKHFVAEGQVEFRGLLFVPKRAPFEMFTRENRHNLKLYVRRVFISDKSDDMVPEWLNFVKGIVDSDDLPLNVSRELLQQSNSMRIIRKGVVKKCIELFQELARDRPEDYKTFYSHFHKNLKLGIHEDKNNNLSKLVELLRFYSSKSEQEYTTLQDYVQRMKEGQKNIYYITGESVLQVKNSPFLEKLRKRGFEVLYMVDAIDEYMLQKFQYYKDMKLVCITKEGTQIEGESEEEQKALKEEFKDTCAKIKEILADRVKDVTVSNRITESPAVLVAGEQSLSANMERILKAQAMQNNDQMSFLFMHKKTLEINPDHKLIKSLKERISKGEDISSVKDIVHMLFETSLLGSGFALDDPSKFIQRIYRMMTVGMSLEEDEVEQTEEVVVEEATPVISSRMEEVD